MTSWLQDRFPFHLLTYKRRLPGPRMSLYLRMCIWKDYFVTWRTISLPSICYIILSQKITIKSSYLKKRLVKIFQWAEFLTDKRFSLAQWRETEYTDALRNHGEELRILSLVGCIFKAEAETCLHFMLFNPIIFSFFVIRN